MTRAELAVDRMAWEQLLHRIDTIAANIEKDYWSLSLTSAVLQSYLSQLSAIAQELRTRGVQMQLQV